jgi:hypothetical protein
LWYFPIYFEKLPTATQTQRNQRDALLAAMNAWSAETGGLVDFDELPAGSTYTPRVKFVRPDFSGSTPSVSDDWCQSGIGKRTSTVQTVRLLDCGDATTQHELGHLLGYEHEHLRSDRNRYIELNQNELCDDSANAPCTAADPICVTKQRFRDNVRMCSTAGGPEDEGLIGPFDMKSVMNYGSVALDGGKPCTDADPSGCDRLTRTDNDSVPGGDRVIGGTTVSAADGSGLHELYAQARGWKLFQPVIRNDPGATTPLDTRLTSGVRLTKSPALARWATSDLIALVRGDDNHIYTKTNPGADMSWPSLNWEDRGGDFSSRPAAVSWAANRLDVVATGTNNNVYHKWYSNGTWGASWTSLGRPPGTASVSAPTIASWGTNRLDIFVRTGTHLYQRSWTSSGWSASWVDRGCCIKGDPAAVSWGPDRIDVVATGTNDEVWHLPYDSGWGDWDSIGGSVSAGTSPAIASGGEDELNVYVVGESGRLYHQAWAGEWSGWGNIGGRPTQRQGEYTSPGAYTQSNGRAHVAANINNGRHDGVWHRYWEP